MDLDRDGRPRWRLRSEYRADRSLEPLPFASIWPEEGDDGAAPPDGEGHAGRSSGAGARGPARTDPAVSAGWTSEQLVDPTGHRVQGVLVDPWIVGRGIRVRPGKDRRKPVCRIGIKAVAH